MINNINEIKECSKKFIREFLEHCTVEEKIDAYYVTVEVRSSGNVYRKASGKKISREDYILNSMYGRLRKDWDMFRMANEEWFSERIGMKIHMFYLPCHKPILTEYKPEVTYIIKDLECTKVSAVMSDLHHLPYASEFGIDVDSIVKKCFDKISLPEDVNKKLNALVIDLKNPERDANADILRLLADEQPYLWAAEKPEGYIFKMGKHIYQCNIGNSSSEERVAKSEKAQYEYLLLDFIQYWKDLDDEKDVYKMMVPGDYIKTVCNLFNDYLSSRELLTHKIEKNIDAKSLEAPCIGKRFDMGYDYIPDSKTLEFCRNNELYRNIFKILLVNLKRAKKPEHCLLLKPEKVDDWNNIIKIIANICGLSEKK